MQVQLQISLTIQCSPYYQSLIILIRELYSISKIRNIPICCHSAISSTREEFLILTGAGGFVCVDRNLRTCVWVAIIQQNKHLSQQHDTGAQQLGKHLTRPCSVCSYQLKVSCQKPK